MATQAQLLEALYECYRDTGNKRINKDFLSQRSGLTRATINGLAAGLYRIGLVSHLVTEYVSITDEGIRVVEEANKLRTEEQTKVTRQFDSLSPLLRGIRRNK